MNNKILIAYGFHKSGHYFASKTIQKNLQSNGFEVDLLDVWKNKSPLLTRVMNIFKDIQKEKLPIFPEFFSDYEFINLLLQEVSIDFNLSNYDGIVSTHPYTSLLFANQISENIPLIDVHTDFTPTPIFSHPRIKYHIGPFLKHEVSFNEYSKLIQGDIPVRRTKTSKGNGILIMGGAAGFGAIEETYNWLENSNLENPVTIVCGDNNNLYEHLKNKKNIQVKGFVKNFNTLFKDQKYILTKASGITVSEILSNGRTPIVYPSVVPWEDEASINLAGRGLGFRIAEYSESELNRLKYFISSTELNNSIQETYSNLDLEDSCKTIIDIFRGIRPPKYLNSSYPSRILKNLSELKTYNKHFQKKAIELTKRWGNEE